MRTRRRLDVVLLSWLLVNVASCGNDSNGSVLLDATSNGTSSGPSYTLFEPRTDDFTSKVIRRGPLSILRSARDVPQSFYWEWQTRFYLDLRGSSDSEHIAPVTTGRRDVSERTREKGPIWREPGGSINMSDISGRATLYGPDELPASPTRFVVTLQASIVGQEKQYSNGWNKSQVCSEAEIALACLYTNQAQKERDLAYKSGSTKICDTRGDWQHTEVSIATNALDFSECREKNGHLQVKVLFKAVRQAQFQLIHVDELN